MAITYTVGQGSYIRPVRSNRIRTWSESASQTFIVGDVLIQDAASHKGTSVKISTNTPTTGTVRGIAMAKASGVTGADVPVAMLDEQGEFYIHLGDTQTASNDDIGLEYGVVADATNKIWRLDNTNTTQKVFRVVDFATNPQTGVKFADGDINAAYIVRPAYAVQNVFKS